MDKKFNIGDAVIFKNERYVIKATKEIPHKYQEQIGKEENEILSMEIFPNHGKDYVIIKEHSEKWNAFEHVSEHEITKA